MLALFRSKRESLKWVLWFVIVVLGAGMVLLFVQTPAGSSGTLPNEVAKVAGQSVTIQQFRRQYGQMLQLYQQQLGDQFDRFRDQLRLGDQVINQMINEYAITYEAERLGLSVAPEEISQRVTSFPVFQEEGTGRFVGVTRYQQILAANSLTASDFEEGLRRQILREKLTSLLTDGIEPSLEAIQLEFAAENQQVKIRYAFFDPEQTVAEDVGEEELKTFYEEQSGLYTIPERRKVQYVSIPIDPEAVTISDEDINARLSDVPLQQQVRARHILFRVPTGEDDAEARQRAQTVLRQIRSGADFGEMARQYSEDSSAVSGGDLGFFGRGQMVPDFERVAFSLAEGAVSDLVKSPFGIHLIQTTVSPATPEAAQRLVAEYQLKVERAQSQAEELAKQLLQEGQAAGALNEAASAKGLQVQDTGYFTLEGSEPIPGARIDFNQQVFALGTDEFVGPYQAGREFIVAKLDGVEAAVLQPFEEVREKAVSDFKEMKRDILALSRARELFEQASEKGSLEAAAAEKGSTVVTTDFFKKGDTVDDVVKFSPIIHDRAYSMSVGEVSPPVTVAGKYVVFEVAEKTELDMAAFESSKETIANRLRQTGQDSFFSAYMQNVVDQLRKDNEIAINQELLDAIAS